MAKNCHPELCIYIIHNISVGQHIVLYDTNQFDYVYLLLLDMFYEAIVFRILLSSRSLGNPPSMICIYIYFEGVKIKPF